MIDYIAWLLEQEEGQEEAQPLLERREFSLPRPRPQVDLGEQELTLPAGAAALPLQGEMRAAARAAETAQALQDARGQRAHFADTPAAAPFEAAVQEGGAARRRAEARSSARLRGESAEAGRLYERIRGARRGAEAAGLLGERRAFAAETAAGAQPAPFDLAALDRCFERDARRYDSGGE